MVWYGLKVWECITQKQWWSRGGIKEDLHFIKYFWNVWNLYNEKLELFLLITRVIFKIKKVTRLIMVLKK